MVSQSGTTKQLFLEEDLHKVSAMLTAIIDEASSDPLGVVYFSSEILNISQTPVDSEKR